MSAPDPITVIEEALTLADREIRTALASLEEGLRYYENANRRIEELEAALREILMSDGLGGASEVMRDIARRALQPCSTWRRSEWPRIRLG